MRSSKTKQLFIFYAFLAVIGLAGYVFFFLYVERAGARTAAAAAEIVNLEQQKEQYSQYNSAIKNIQDNKAILDRRLVDKDKLVNFLEAIEGLKDTTGALVSVQSIKEGESKTVIKNLRLDISVEGTWEQVYRFFTLLENMPFNMTLEKVTIGKSADSWHGTVTVTVVELSQNQ